MSGITSVELQVGKTCAWREEYGIEIRAETANETYGKPVRPSFHAKNRSSSTSPPRGRGRISLPSSSYWFCSFQSMNLCLSVPRLEEGATKRIYDDSWSSFPPFPFKDMQFDLTSRFIAQSSPFLCPFALRPSTLYLVS
jgi:hypothetical protein